MQELDVLYGGIYRKLSKSVMHCIRGGNSKYVVRLDVDDDQSGYYLD